MRQQLGITALPQTVTFVRLVPPAGATSDDVQDEQHVLFHCTHPHVVSLPMQDFNRGFEVQTAEGTEASGCSQSLRGEQESSD
eukprot:310869-Pelagomonas_calceolata.AAC.1